MITNALTKLQKIFPSQFKNAYTEALSASTKIPLKGKVKKKKKIAFQIWKKQVCCLSRSVNMFNPQNFNEVT